MAKPKSKNSLQSQPQPPSLQALGDTFNFPGVMERSYAGFDNNGEAKPTMDWMNPRWASWFDEIKQKTGQNPTFANAGGLRKLPNSPTGVR